MESLGIELKLLVGQIINFLLLFILLSALLYKPILKMLNERRQKVAESLENAKKIEEDLASSQEKTRAMLEKASKDATAQIESALKIANEQKREIIEAAKAQSDKIIESAQKEAATAKDNVVKQAKKEKLTKKAIEEIK